MLEKFCNSFICNRILIGSGSCDCQNFVQSTKVFIFVFGEKIFYLEERAKKIVDKYIEFAPKGDVMQMNQLQVTKDGGIYRTFFPGL